MGFAAHMWVRLGKRGKEKRVHALQQRKASCGPAFGRRCEVCTLPRALTPWRPLAARTPTPQMPTFKLPPPFEEGWTLQDGVVVTRDMHATLTDMLTLMNTAVARLPDLRPGSGGGGGGAV